jgi:hypothetical protein
MFTACQQNIQTKLKLYFCLGTRATEQAGTANVTTALKSLPSCYLSLMARHDLGLVESLTQLSKSHANAIILHLIFMLYIAIIQKCSSDL